MTSWRDGASPGAQDDLDSLLDGVLNLADEHLTKHGSLAPVALALNHGGDGLLVAADPQALPAEPLGEDVRLQLYTQLIAGISELRATAVAVDVTVPGRGDAVRVELEHSEGASMAVLAPYTRSGGHVSFGELQAVAASPMIWVVR